MYAFTHPKTQRLDETLRCAVVALEAVRDSMHRAAETNVSQDNVALLRQFIHVGQAVVGDAQTSLALRIVLNQSKQRTTRTDYLVSARPPAKPTIVSPASHPAEPPIH